MDGNMNTMKLKLGIDNDKHGDATDLTNFGPGKVCTTSNNVLRVGRRFERTNPFLSNTKYKSMSSG
jgi:hypothetical protein